MTSAHSHHDGTPASPSPSPCVLTGREAISLVEALICGDAATRDAAAAEGFALAGWRAASLPGGSRGRAPGAVDGIARSCVHHVDGLAGPSLDPAWPVSLAAATHQEIVDHALVAHLVSHALGQAACCSLGPPLDRRLGLVRLPSADTVEAVLGGELEGTDDDAPDAVAEVVARAFAAVAEHTGRAASPLEVIGAASGGVEVAMVAHGASIPAMTRTTEALAEVGVKARGVGLRLLAPLPAQALRGALAGAPTVLVAEDRAHSGALTAKVRDALGDGALVASVPVDARPCGALWAAVAHVLPKLEGKEPLRDAARGPSGDLLVAPGGPWGDALTRRIIAALPMAAALTIDRAEADAAGPAHVALCGAELPAALADKDALVASDVTALDPEAALLRLRRGSLVILHSRASDALALAKQLSERQRRIIGELRLDVRWLDARPGDGPAAEADFDAALASAAAAALSGAAGGAERLTADALDPARHVSEVDFRARRAALRLPEPLEGGPDASWRRAVWRFHLRGDGLFTGVGPPPGTAAVPAAIRALAAATGGQRRFPLVVHASEQGVVGRPLATMLAELTALAAGAGSALEGHLPALRRHVEGTLGVCADAVFGAAELRAAGEALLSQLTISAADAARYEGDLRQVAAVWPAQARIVPLTSRAPLLLHNTALRLTRDPHRRALVGKLRALLSELDEALLVDDLKGPKAHEAAALTKGLGAMSSLFDASALSNQLASKAGGPTLTDDRRARLTGAREAIQRWLTEDLDEPTVVYLAHPDTAIPSTVAGCRVVRHADPLAAASGLFDGLARRTAGLITAMRTARLELDGACDPALHDDALAQLDWQALTPEELDVLPTLVTVTTGERLRDNELTALSTLLRSSRPVQVLVQDQAAPGDGADDLAGFHADLGYLAVAHREAFVVQSALARPERLVTAMGRMARARRPSVAVISLPTAEPAGMRWLRTEAALHGRVCPSYLYDPDAGESWADRFDLGGNPAADGPWPRLSVAAEHADGRKSTLPLALTFADAVALEPPYFHHLRVIPADAWGDDQIPLADWLAQGGAALEARQVPFIWVLGDDGDLQRAIVTRELAFASRDRLRTWRVLQELGGHDNAFVQRAAARAEVEADARLTEQTARLAAEHAAELDRVRNDTAREAMERLAAVLMNLDTPPASAAVTRPAPFAAAPTGGDALQQAPAAAPAPAPADDDEEEDDLPLGQAHIDSVLCTSCNECVNLDSSIFVYNGDKQAFIADPAAAPFELLVKAAEACASRCIHPGVPRGDDATASSELIERAKAFQ